MSWGKLIRFKVELIWNKPMIKGTKIRLGVKILSGFHLNMKFYLTSVILVNVTIVWMVQICQVLRCGMVNG